MTTLQATVTSTGGSGSAAGQKERKGIMESRAIGNLKPFDDKTKFRLFSERLVGAMDQVRQGAKIMLDYAIEQLEVKRTGGQVAQLQGGIMVGKFRQGPLLCPARQM